MEENNIPFQSHSKEEMKSHVEIIYNDKNVVAMIPKTQVGSMIYGRKTKWCQLYSAGFRMWSEKGLLIRFLLKGGRFIRFTYFYEKQTKENSIGGCEPGNSDDGQDHKFYWSTENGYHILFGNESNPFLAKPKNTDKVRDTEKDALELIDSIPSQCKSAVLEFISKNVSQIYSYKYFEGRDYTPRALVDFEESYKKLYKEFHQAYDFYDRGISLDSFINTERRTITIVHGESWNEDGGFKERQKEVFKSIELYKHRMNELIVLYQTFPKKERKVKQYTYGYYEGEFYNTEGGFKNILDSGAYF